MKRSTFRMAWRGLWRHPRRTILMVLMVAFASLVIIVMWGVMDGFMASMVDSQIAVDQGSIKIRATGYDEDPAPEHGLSPNAVAAAESALAAAGIDTYASRLSVYGMVKSAYGATGIEIRGIDLEGESRVTSLPSQIAVGRGLANPGEILLSEEIARRLDVRIGERVVVLAQADSGPQSLAVTAVGFFGSGIPNLDKAIVLVALADAQRLAVSSGATEVVISLPRTQKAESVSAGLRAALGDAFVVKSYFEANPLIKSLIEAARVEMLPIIFILALLAGFGVANTVLFSVLERTREFGVMIAVGMSPKRLGRIVQLEALVASALGFVVGGSLGYLALLALTRGITIGTTWASMAGDLSMPAKLYASASGIYLLGSLAVVLSTALIAAWYPARRAAGLQPVEAIREA
ncbi:MAG: ABC transporter permease [Candidatus Bipolaricaulis sp.]|nr:ABC transporter permease [Candidatus Bipolaricaulis sp.]